VRNLNERILHTGAVGANRKIKKGGSEPVNERERERVSEKEREQE
jgi:hypothetical protein